MRKPRVYIGGKMTGVLNHNRDAFQYAWNRLMRAGYTAVSPHHLENGIEIDVRALAGKGEIYKYALPIDLFALSSCDGMMVLPDSDESNGLKFEIHGAGLFEIPVVDGYGLLPRDTEMSLEAYMDRVIIYLETEAHLCPTTVS